MKAFRLALCVVVLALCACSKEEAVRLFAPPEKQAVAQGYLDALRAGRLDEIERDLDPRLKAGDLRATLGQMVKMFPPGEPRRATLIGAQTFRSAEGDTTNLSFEYDYGDRWLLANVATRERDGQRTIVGINVYPRTQSLDDENRFTLADKGAARLSVLGAAVLAASVTIWALVLCLRTRPLRRKALWIVFILLGFGTLAIDWTTGRWGINPFAFQVLSASATAAPYGPWVVSVSLPVGAIAFLLRRFRARARPAGEPG